jgi:uncharacterized membrane protein
LGLCEKIKRMTFENTILVVGGALTALVAGLFFGFAVAVNGGLHRLKDSEYIAAMQSINTVILNPVFYVSFFGPVVLLALAAFLHRDVSATRFLFLVGSAVLYIFGTFGITVVGNIPLNQQLAKFDLSTANDAEIASARARFEGPWNRLHLIRTILSIAAIILILTGCLSN